MTTEQYFDFDIETCTSVSIINSEEVDWRESSVGKCVSEYPRKQSEVSDIEEVPHNDDSNECVDKGEEK